MKAVITNHCIIREHTIALNGHLIFRHADQEDSLDNFLTAAYRFLGINYPKFFKMDALCKLAFLTTEVLVSAQPVSEQYRDTELGITLCNGSSSILTDLTHQKTIQHNDTFFPSPAVFVYTLPNIMIGEISIRHQIRGDNTLFLAEKFDSVTVSQYTQYLLTENIAKACICGWVEANPDQYDAFVYLVESADHLPDNLSYTHSVDSINTLYISQTF